jgi:4-diphosphocytidyl-2-C-methyl-D-erythritol kinase
MSETLRVCCPAKINLSLEILGRRPDGYHELRTVFQAVSLADELTVTVGGRSEFKVTGLPVKVDSNLCLTALAEFQQAVPDLPPVSLHLHKVIPWGAGLGGGSSDAAGTLAALAHWHGEVLPETLHALATRLGSDVAFFLQGGTMLGEGRGEVLEPLPAPAEGILVIAKPAPVVPTPRAYGLLKPQDFTDGSHTEALIEQLQTGCGLREMAPSLYNGFARVVEQRWPPIRQLRERLLASGASAALLSGSGAAVFGVYDDPLIAQAAVTALGDEGIWAVTARPVSHGAKVNEEA